MRGREALALIGIGAATFGSLEAALQYDTMAGARGQAITIETCGRVYDGPPAPDNGDQEAPHTTPIDFATLADWHEPEAGSGSDEEKAVQLIPLDPGHYVVTKQTIECMEEGWVQNGNAVNTSNIEVGDPELLLQAFAKLEKSRGEHFDPSSTLVGGLAGAALGGLIALRIAIYEERELEREEEEDQEADDEEIRRRGIYDQEADPDLAT